MDTLGTHRVHHSEYRRSTAILIFLISWGPPFGFFDGNLWISYNKNPKGGPHEIRKIKIAVDLWYSLWWTLWVPKVSMSSFEKIHYWEGWKLPGPPLLKRSWPCPFKKHFCSKFKYRTRAMANRGFYIFFVFSYVGVSLILAAFLWCFAVIKWMRLLLESGLPWRGYGN